MSILVGYFCLMFSLFGVEALGGHLGWRSWALILGVPGAVLALLCLVGAVVARVSAYWLAGMRVLFTVPAWVLGVLATLGAAAAAAAVVTSPWWLP
ncbi:hypothetical protein MO973_16315 [Paenibacillus sp. TRM 82003]|uniref:hypothetical protein n=1 Tax=Kineococcus sp. TRM81007 TaxID=2925831 RepID=UPI001F55DF18|nr:hypothetical protein [Kineococcus sp. TRM81007]MCI2237777.1 hypothetical protein [Kineococcus sp. TRM81007]MCI3921796.1 hypothetical protein [Paenibacillus sp. TRM 82003]